MLEKQTDALLEVFAGALEATAFVTLEPGGASGAPEGAMKVTIRVFGAARGEIALLAPRAFGVYLAANVLATDPSDAAAAAQAEDSLKEIVNVSAGQYLSRIAAGGTVAEMGLPEVTPVTPGEWSAMAGGAGAVSVTADGFPVVFAVTTENVLAEAAG